LSGLPFTVSYEDIKRGKIYLAGIPFDDGRPLSFLENDGGSLSILQKPYGFEPATDEATGREYSPEVAVVIPHKAKLAVVLQTDSYNADPNWHYTIIAPIDSIGAREKEKSIIQRVIARNDLDRIHYISCTGHDAIIEITKIRRSHKNLIFKPTRWEVPAQDLEYIMVKLASVLKIEKIPACSDCEMNCDNCELKTASSQ